MQTAYRSATAFASLATATSGLLSQQSQWPLLKLFGADALLAHCSSRGALFLVIAKLAQDPIVWFAAALSIYCVLLAVVLRREKAPRNRASYLPSEILEES